MKFAKNIFLSLLFIILLVSCGEQQAEGIKGWWVVDTGYTKESINKSLKSASGQEKLGLEMMLKSINQLADQMTMVINEKEFIGYYATKETKATYELSNVEGNTYTIVVQGKEQKFILENGRIYEFKNGSNSKVYFRRLTDSEIVTRKKKHFKTPAPAPAPAKKAAN